MHMNPGNATGPSLGFVDPMLRGMLIGRVRDELQQRYGTVAEMTFFLVVGMVTFACQDGVYVRYRGGIVPITGYYVLSAPPGSGKSALLTRLLEPFHRAEIDAAAESRRQYVRYQADRLIWKGRVRRLTGEIEDAITDKKRAGSLDSRLIDLLGDEPLPPVTASWLTEDATIQALRRRLHKAWPSAGIVLDEGIRFFSSTLSRAFADFCTLHDARLAKNERVTTGVESIGNAFLSMVIATQWGPLFDYLNEHGKKAFDTGFLARLQLLDVRHPVQPSASSAPATLHKALAEYDSRVSSLKCDARIRMRKDGTFDPVVIDVSEAAEASLGGVSRMLNSRSAASRFSSDMDPYLLRLPVLIARLAGVLHRFEGYEGPITETTMRLAAEVGLWLAYETNAVLLRSRQPSSTDKADIDTLVDMLRVHAHRHRRLFIRKSELSAMAPSFGVDEARCKRALHHLCAAGWAWLEEARGNGGRIVRLSPHYFSISR